MNWVPQVGTQKAIKFTVSSAGRSRREIIKSESVERCLSSLLWLLRVENRKTETETEKQKQKNRKLKNWNRKSLAVSVFSVVSFAGGKQTDDYCPHSAHRRRGEIGLFCKRPGLQQVLINTVTSVRATLNLSHWQLIIRDLSISSPIGRKYSFPFLGRIWN